MRWGAAWYFEFPAGYFERGIHILVGTWTVTNLPCDCVRASWTEEESLEADLASENGLYSWTDTSSLTLTVLYP